MCVYVEYMWRVQCVCMCGVCMCVYVCGVRVVCGVWSVWCVECVRACGVYPGLVLGPLSLGATRRGVPHYRDFIVHT